jgi:hypothetical protein
MLRAPLLISVEPSGLKARAVIGAALAAALNKQAKNRRTAAFEANPKSRAAPRGSSSSFVLVLEKRRRNENEDEAEGRGRSRWRALEYAFKPLPK